MKKDETINVDGRKKKTLVLRKESIRSLDNTDLSHVNGGAAWTTIPPDGSSPPQQL